jgi:hypothetical protein
LSVTGRTGGQLDHFTHSCSGKTSSGDYTYLFRAPIDGTYDFSVESDDFDAVVSLRGDGPAGPEIACNDDRGGPNPSVSYALCAGQDVAVVVDGFDGSFGDYRLSITLDQNDRGRCCDVGTTRVGCIDSATARCVCQQRPACCREVWNALCAASVASLGCDSCGS